MKRAKKWLVAILAALSLTCVGMACASCEKQIDNPSVSEDSGSSPSESEVGSSIPDSTEPPKEEVETGALAYSLLDNGTYAVNVGTAKQSKNIVIPDVYNGKAVTTISENGFEGCQAESITIPNSVTSIGARAFYECDNIKKITIGNGVKEIGEGAFDTNYFRTAAVYINDLAAWCEISFSGYASNPLSLVAHDLYLNDALVTELEIPKEVTSIGDFAFYCCNSLTSVTMGDNVTSIGRAAFMNCSNLMSATIGNGVTSVGELAFEQNNRLTSLTVGKNVTSIGSRAFLGCIRLVEIYDLSNLAIQKGLDENGYVGYYAEIIHTSSEEKSNLTITDDGFKFYADEERSYLVDHIGKETTLILPDYFNGKNYELYEGALVSCDGLKSVTIGAGVTRIGDSAFYGCVNLESVTFGSGVTSIGNLAFYNCLSLTSVTIGESVTSIESSAFANCCSLASVTIGENVTSIGNGAFYKCSSLTSVTIGERVTSIGGSAFESCSSLTSVAIPNSVKSIRNWAFAWCSSLKSVTIPDNVTSIGDNVFFGCSGLTSIEVSEKNTVYSSIDGVLFDKDQTTLICYPAGKEGSYAIPDGVTIIGAYAFHQCSGLASVTIPDSVTSIGSWVFRNCSGLTSIEVDENNTVYSSIDGVLFNKDQTTLICYPAGKEGSAYAIPDGVTSIEAYAFYQCSGLTSVTIPDGVTSIGSYAFYNCSGLTSVTIPDGVTSIGSWAFRNCSGLTSVTIPNSVMSIGGYAFSNCSSLKRVYYTGTEEEWNKISLASYSWLLTSAARYYYSESEPTVSGKWWHYADGAPTVWGS